MSAKEKAINIIDHMTEEQLQGFIMMFGKFTCGSMPFDKITQPYT